MKDKKEVLKAFIELLEPELVEEAKKLLCDKTQVSRIEQLNKGYVTNVEYTNDIPMPAMGMGSLLLRKYDDNNNWRPTKQQAIAAIDFNRLISDLWKEDGARTFAYGRHENYTIAGSTVKANSHVFHAGLHMLLQTNFILPYFDSSGRVKEVIDKYGKRLEILRNMGGRVLL